MLFSSKRFDESIGLSYFGARCYDAFIGRFISRDPIGYIDGANQYIYAANNPLRFIDPFGLENYLILVHGTDFEKAKKPLHISDWAKGNSRTAGVIAKQYSVPYKNVITFNWTGKNTKEARHNAAIGLTSTIQNIRQNDPKAIITTAAHSHGGNIVIESTNLGAYHENVITMGTPVRDDYVPNYINIGNHLNIYNKNDIIQVVGGYTDINPPPQNSSIYYDVSTNIPLSKSQNLKPTHLEVGVAGRIFPKAKNIEITSSSSGLNAHSAVYNPNILKKQVFSKKTTGKRCP